MPVTKIRSISGTSMETTSDTTMMEPVAVTETVTSIMPDSVTVTKERAAQTTRLTPELKVGKEPITTAGIQSDLKIEGAPELGLKFETNTETTISKTEGETTETVTNRAEIEPDAEMWISAVGSTVIKKKSKTVTDVIETKPILMIQAGAMSVPELVTGKEATGIFKVTKLRDADSPTSITETLVHTLDMTSEVEVDTEIEAESEVIEKVGAVSKTTTLETMSEMTMKTSRQTPVQLETPWPSTAVLQTVRVAEVIPSLITTKTVETAGPTPTTERSGSADTEILRKSKAVETSEFVRTTEFARTSEAIKMSSTTTSEIVGALDDTVAPKETGTSCAGETAGTPETNWTSETSGMAVVETSWTAEVSGSVMKSATMGMPGTSLTVGTAVTSGSTEKTETVTSCAIDEHTGDLSKVPLFSFLFRKQRVRARPRRPPPPRAPSGPQLPPRPPSDASRPADGCECVEFVSPLQAAPTGREVIDHRSKTVEQILEVLKKGTQLWKIRSFTKWYRRTYFLDDKEGTVRYEPSHKAPCIHSPLRIVVDDIVDVRKGWKTDTFNKIEKKVERRRIKFPSQPSPVDERCCFSIIYSSNKQSLDLVAPEPKIADMWVRGLRHIVTVLKGLHQEERFERWLEQQFHEADVDNNNGLNFEESLKLLKQLNVKMPRNSVKKFFDEANTVKHTRNGEQVLDADEFVSFYMKLMSRSDIKEIYSRYTKNNKEMTVSDLVDFIHKEQKGHTTTKEECLSLIEAFEQSNLKTESKLSLIGFTNMLMSEQFDVLKQSHKVVYQDMHQPLSHYYIATSHNTYLTGNQLHGESSVEGYIDALKQGCRCVEMDCWDGPDGEPIIYHGYTLTSKILFRDVLVDAIKPYAFYSSEYPVILSLENHLSRKQQEVLTKHLIDILGDMLYTDPVNESWEFLPSPEALKHKIIIKAKKKASTSNTEDDNGSSTEEEAEPPPGVDSCDKGFKGKCEVTPALSCLVNVCEAVHFNSFEDTAANKKCYQMSSFSEAKANKFIETKGPDFVKYNTKHLSRIYPAGTRTDSSNFKPIPYWNVGCQLVALNYQHAAKPMLYNDAKFHDNGGCGYVLKPEVLRRNTPVDPDATDNDRNQVTLKLTVISGQHIPKADNDSEGEIVDPYVKVKILGHPKDNQKIKTEAVRNNGFNPRWDHEMSFNIKMPELAIIHFIVKDLSSTGKDVTLGTYAIPFHSLQQGYSHVYLKDYERNFVSPASLFIHACVI